MMKIGLGQDTHRLVEGRRFLLGGIELPAKSGELGHSDGDVLAHAVCDAILGAAALGDIGSLFPPSNPQWKDADSMQLLRSACNMVKQAGWTLVSLDCVVCCEQPKVLPYRDDIRRSLSDTLEVSLDKIFLKGKTGEGIGPVGIGEAVEVLAICLLERE